ncbi:MAG: PilW family protein [Halioglobus sp.]
MQSGARQAHCGSSEGGLSLVELMVSMLLGMLLSAGVISAYMLAKRNYFYEEQTARIQENGRYALRLISRELGMAGFFGGLPSLSEVVPASVATDCADGNWVLNGRDPLELVNNHAGESTPVSLQGTALTCFDGATVFPASDILAIKRTASEASLLWGVPAATLSRTSTESWYLRVTSGGSAQWEKLRPRDLLDPGRTVPTQSYWEAISRIFYVRSPSVARDGGEDSPALCMETLAGDEMTSRCLVEGVENMQLEFGIDTDSDGVPNQYLSAPASGEMEHAVAVRIYLLLRSTAELTGHRDDSNYRLGATNVAATHDAYLRRVFSSTVFLRNRIRPLG